MAKTNEGQAAVLEEAARQSNKIDPTVPLMGIPESAVESASWDVIYDTISRPGLPDQVFEYKVPKINGIKMSAQTTRAEWRKILDWFPKTVVMLQETETERNKRMENPNTRAVQAVVWNTVPFTMPKGVPVEVPQPIADIVKGSDELYKSEALQQIIARQVQRGSYSDSEDGE